MQQVKKVVLAYSGGVDTSVCIPYLKNEYGITEVVTFVADLGQGEDLEFIRQKALNSYQIDEIGLDSLDRQYLSFLNQNNNIPTGLDSIAAGLGDDSSMLEFVVEPYLIQIGFLTRTPRGRLLTPLGKKYINSKNDNF